MNMKKLIPALAILGSAVAFAVYKLKKDEKKKLMELDQDLLVDEDLVDSPSNVSTMDKVVSDMKDSAHGMVDFASQKAEKVLHKGAQVASDVEKFMHSFKQDAMEKKEEFVGSAENKIDEIIREIETPSFSTEEIKEIIKEENKEDVVGGEQYSEQYPNLTTSLVDDINTMTQEAMNSLAKDGDIHERERPVQHMVSFSTEQDLDAFKNKVINKGFVITKGEGELDLIVLHISPIDKEKLVSNILYLADQAYANHGIYKGWQSKVSY